MDTINNNWFNRHGGLLNILLTPFTIIVLLWMVVEHLYSMKKCLLLGHKYEYKAPHHYKCIDCKHDIW